MFACICLQDGRTALHLAASYGNYEIVKILVSACANVDTTSIKVSVLPVLLSGGGVLKHGVTDRGLTCDFKIDRTDEYTHYQ